MRLLTYGVPVGAGNAPVAVVPVEPGTQGFMTPVLSVFPDPIDALLAPVALFPASEEVAAIEVVDVDGLCDAMLAVRLQALVAAGGVCANAAAEQAMPIASEAEKMKRDIRSSKNSLSRWSEDRLFVTWVEPKPLRNDE